MASRLMSVMLPLKDLELVGLFLRLVVGLELVLGDFRSLKLLLRKGGLPAGGGGARRGGGGFEERGRGGFSSARRFVSNSEDFSSLKLVGELFLLEGREEEREEEREAGSRCENGGLLSTRDF